MNTYRRFDAHSDDERLCSRSSFPFSLSCLSSWSRLQQSSRFTLIILLRLSFSPKTCGGRLRNDTRCSARTRSSDASKRWNVPETGLQAQQGRCSYFSPLFYSRWVPYVSVSVVHDVHVPFLTFRPVPVEVVLPSLRWPWLSWPLCILIATNMFMHYYYVCTVPPGFVGSSPTTRRHSFLWAKRRQTAKNRALTGVRWSEDITLTKALLTKCKRCGEMRPEVSMPPQVPTALRAYCDVARERTTAVYATSVSSSMTTIVL